MICFFEQKELKTHTINL